MCATDRKSLGTTHCGSAILKVRDEKDRVLDGFIRGCINCAGKITCDKKKITNKSYVKDDLILSVTQAYWD